MTEPDTSLCTHCGEHGVGAFVQHGSYFTMCTKCHNQGPATSWKAVSAYFEGNLRGVRVDSKFEEIEVVADGDAKIAIKLIAKAAGQGHLVQLRSTACA